MIRASAWTYLDAMVLKRRQVEFRSVIGGGYTVILKGFEHGSGSTCKEALLVAIKSSNRRKDHAR